MKTTIRLFLAILLASLFSATIATAGHTLPTAEIQAVVEARGEWTTAGRVLKFTKPRNEIAVAIDGRALPAAMIATSWVAFRPGANFPAIVTGEFVLFEDEIDRALDAALAGGLQVTSLHHQFFRDDPKLYVMQVLGQGDGLGLARGVNAVFAQIAAQRTAPPDEDGPSRTIAQIARRSELSKLPRSSSISTGPLETMLEEKAESAGGTARFVWGRTAKIACGAELDRDMGVSTWATFYGANTNSVVCGALVVEEAQLQDTLATLRRGNISIAAVHHHMVGETPRLMEIAFWGRGFANDLARSLKASMHMATATPVEPTVAVIPAPLTSFVCPVK